MKKIFLATLLIALAAVPAFALAARFDFTAGTPSVMDDGVSSASDTFEQTRYDFSNGVPTPILDSTAVEDTPPGPSGPDTGGVIFF